MARGNYSAGLHQLVWDGRNDAQKELPSGVYFYRLSANGKQLTKKMILMK
ncbi:MAG: T9SS type A sorting domain-containing protein [Caldisericaceae bacterium]|nr:T9SS type A sorting domain-containing protein [Caldisericaceae bacterium]